MDHENLSRFNLETLLSQVKNTEAWKKGDRGSIVLRDGGPLRVVLIAMHASSVIPPHKVDSPISVQTVEGSIIFKTDKESVSLGKGQILTLEAGIQHSLEALEESAFLLTRTTNSRPIEG